MARNTQWQKCDPNGTTSFPRSSFVRPSVPRLDTYTDHSIEIVMFPDLYRDIHIPDQLIEIYMFPDHSIDTYTYSDHHNKVRSSAFGGKIVWRNDDRKKDAVPESNTTLMN